MPHFEIHVQDVEAAKSFYGGLFGWQFEAIPGLEEAGYHMIQGDGIGGANGLTAALMLRADSPPDAGSPIRGGTMTFEVADCDARYDWALAHGGAEALPPTDYPGIGRCACVEDGQGNVVGMMTPAGEDN
ncbi:VOC family protein [Sedimentitalea sp. XS_ASV28]|uniref:VOC family protein n=1 Tax=Sedimentitalea sp. XS_ASV28 TaxID=3241296 RepID=UPI003516340C